VVRHFLNILIYLFRNRVYCWPISDSKWSSALKTFRTGELLGGVAVALAIFFSVNL
jgi:hypothetical protein